MNKPSLKRSVLDRNIITNKKETRISFNTNYKDLSIPQENDTFIIPGKLLEVPNYKTVSGKEKSNILAPLTIIPHIYPPKVDKIVRQQPRQTNRGIGSYKQVNWVYQSNKVELWITGSESSTPYTLENEISYFAIGQLQHSCLPSRVKDNYTAVVAFSNQLTLYCLQPYMLKMWESGFKFTIQHSLQLQMVTFVDGCKLLIGTDTGFLELINFVEEQSIITTFVPLYRKFLPTSFNCPRRKIENMLFSKNKIYVLVNEIKKKGFLNCTYERITSEHPNLYYNEKIIEVHTIDKSQIRLSFKIFQYDINKRMKNFVVGWNNQLNISNIYLDKTGPQEELAIITTKGLLITLRNMDKVYFSKDPFTLPNIATFNESQVLSVKIIDKSRNQNAIECNRIEGVSVVCGLGMNNLNITSQSILLVDQQRVDCIKNFNTLGDICQSHKSQEECSINKRRQWSAYTSSNYYIIKQLPLRHIIIASIYINFSQVDQYHPLSRQQKQFKSFFKRLQNQIGANVILKELIEIIISGEKFISLNCIVLELIEHQFKGEKARDFRDWDHNLSGNIKSKNIIISEIILSQVWNLILTQQYNEVPSEISQSNHICDVDIFWMALHQLYFSLVKPLLYLTPNDFKKQKILIQNIFQSLSSLKLFFEQKHRYQQKIRKVSISKISSKTFEHKKIDEEGDMTSQTILIEDIQEYNDGIDISWADPAVCQTIMEKIITENKIKLHYKCRKAVTVTLSLMTIFFSLAGHSQGLPCFKDVMKNTYHQNIIKKILIERSDYKTLVDIDNRLPQFGLKRDLSFLRWSYKISLQGFNEHKFNTQEMADAIASEYFKKALQVIGNRFDIFIKALQLYEQKIIAQKESLIQANTIKEKYFLGKMIFSDEEQFILTSKRQYLDQQLAKIIVQEKQCFSKSVAIFNQNRASKSIMIDELILIASNKPVLYDHLMLALNQKGIYDKIIKLQKMSYKEYHRFNYNKKIDPRQKYFKRQLFPDQ